MRARISTLLVLLLSPLSACDPEGGNEGNESNEGNDGGAPACEALTDEAACSSEADAADCVWRPALRASRTGDSCVVQETGVCLDRAVLDGPAGCAPLDGCEGSYAAPYYRTDPEGGVVLVDFCGGTPPASLSSCNSGSASQADPPECACACELR